MKKSELKQLIKEIVQELNKDAGKLNETIIYHGDNYNTQKLEPKRMMTHDSNNQEGIGIYFSDDINTAEKYGKNIIKLDISKNKFVLSRDNAGKYININKMIQLLKEMFKINPEEVFYYISDYVEVATADDVNVKHFKLATPDILDNEIRNLQIDLARLVGIEKFVEL